MHVRVSNTGGLVSVFYNLIWLVSYCKNVLAPYFGSALGLRFITMDSCSSRFFQLLTEWYFIIRWHYQLFTHYSLHGYTIFLLPMMLQGAISLHLKRPSACHPTLAPLVRKQSPFSSCTALLTVLPRSKSQPHLCQYPWCLALRFST